MTSSTKRTALVAGLALLGSGLVVTATAPAQANPAGDGLVISEVFVGGGSAGGAYTSDYVELYNPSDVPISVNGLSVQYRSATGTMAATKADLSGSVAPGGHYLVRGSGTGDSALTPDATGSFAASGSSGLLMLVHGTAFLSVPAGSTTGNSAIVDAIGYGSSSASETTNAPSVPVTQSLTRDAAGTDTDVNSADFRAAAPGLQGSQPAEPEPAPTELTISEIQGSGPTSAWVGDPIITRGVVTAAYPSGGFFGFYLQTPGSGGVTDLTTHTASDGLFVYQPYGSGAVTVRPGDHVEVTGTVDEYAGLTQVKIADAATDVKVLAEPAAVPVPVTSTWPGSAAEKESLEGMLYAPNDAFTVTNTYATNQYGEVGLAHGAKPLIQPTEVADAKSAEAAAVASDNAARAITLDDGSSTNFTASSSSAGACGTRPVPCLLNGGLTPPYIANDQPVRVGASVTFGGPVIFSQGGSPSAPTYRFQPTKTVTGPDNAASPATFENDRTPAPDEALLSEVGEPDLKVASFNVLNYFTTLADADDDGTADGTCVGYRDRHDDGVTVRDGCELRGAWDPQDLARQQAKIVSAINSLDADVVGLMEIENSAVLGEAADEATATLVDALNDAAGAEVWAANPSSTDLPPVAEQDVITNAIIYQVASVDRMGPARALGALSGAGEAFSNAREPIAQAFVPDAGGDPILVVVNHFKSKGSGTNDGTGQGNANPDRVAQATALSEWVPTVQDDLGVEATLLIGDFNSYAMEDPLQVLYGEGYTNVEAFSGNDEYSYSFSGLSGSLDHVLANAAAMEFYTGVDIWNINSGESLALEYSRWNYHATDFYAADPYRSSDHDPVIVGLDLTAPGPVDTAVAAEPAVISAKEGGLVEVMVTSANPVSGTVEIRDGERLLAAAPVAEDGTATVTIPGRTLKKGTYVLGVHYSGDDQNNPSHGTVTVTVTNKDEG